MGVRLHALSCGSSMTYPMRVVLVRYASRFGAVLLLSHAFGCCVFPSSGHKLTWNTLLCFHPAAGCISIVLRRQRVAVALYDDVSNELSCAEYVGGAFFLETYCVGGSPPLAPSMASFSLAVCIFVLLFFLRFHRMHVDHQFAQLSELVERLNPGTIVLPSHLKVCKRQESL